MKTHGRDTWPCRPRTQACVRQPPPTHSSSADRANASDWTLRSMKPSISTRTPYLWGASRKRVPGEHREVALGTYRVYSKSPSAPLRFDRCLDLDLSKCGGNVEYWTCENPQTVRYVAFRDIDRGSNVQAQGLGGVSDLNKGRNAIHVGSYLLSGPRNAKSPRVTVASESQSLVAGKLREQRMGIPLN